MVKNQSRRWHAGTIEACQKYLRVPSSKHREHLNTFYSVVILYLGVLQYLLNLYAYCIERVLVLSRWFFYFCSEEFYVSRSIKRVKGGRIKQAVLVK